MNRRRALLLALVLVSGLYFVQLARPLHLEPDSVCYLHTAELAAEGRGLGCPGCDRTYCSIQYPPGYPFIVSWMIRLGLGTPTGFVLLNLAGLAIGLGAAHRMLRESGLLDGDTALALMVLVLMWTPVFRDINNPISDYAFLAVAMLAVRCLTTAARSTGWASWSRVLLASVLGIAACTIRTIGIALVPAVGWAVVSAPGRVERVVNWLRRHRAVSIAATVLTALAGVAGAVLLSRSEYVTIDLKKQYGSGLVANLARTWSYRLEEFGELALNVPMAKLPAMLQPLVLLAGLAMLAVVLLALWSRRRHLGPGDAFIVGVAGIMSIWPFKDSRFWLPVLPLLPALVALWVRPWLSRWPVRLVTAVWLAGFLAIGLVGHAYNTRLSLSGDRFPGWFGDDYLGPVYRAGFGQLLPGDTATVDSTALHVLRRFEPRARAR